MKTALSGTGMVGASDAGPSEHVRGEGEAVAVLRDKVASQFFKGHFLLILNV